MSQRLYSVENEENEVDISNIGQIDNVIAKFIIKDEYHGFSDQWNGVNQGDLEGYVICKENEEIVYYKIYGFGEDCKVLLEYRHLLKEVDRLQIALKNYCDGCINEVGEEKFKRG